jgi:sucrose phosphorylase
MKNQVQLITYVDRLGGGGLRELQALFAAPGAPLHGLFGGVHLLPFFDPIDGTDAGFDPIDHTRVDPRLGDWSDIKSLAQHVDVMGDVIVNHVSSQSPQFLDWSKRGDASPFAGMFLTLSGVFPHGVDEDTLLKVYRPRPGLPLTYAVLANGEKKILWTTFTPQQVDIDTAHPQGQAYLQGILNTFAANGIRMIRLDAVGYAVKKAGTSCFMLPETFAFVDAFAAQAKALGIEVLVEVHSHYQKQVDLAKRVDWVYDFALPPLVLHALIFADVAPLLHWVKIRPTNALTVLDTHDGIGIIDIGADATDKTPGLVEPAQLDRLVEAIHANSGGQSREATGAAASNLDLYQVNCTFYDALARSDRAYLIARAIQCFLPGIPQVYYVGLLAGENDMALLQRTQVGRDINRHHYTRAEIDAALHKPVVQDLCDLIRLRNTHPAFGGHFSCESTAASNLTLTWRKDAVWVCLQINVATHSMTVLGDHGRGQETMAWRCMPQVAVTHA